MALPVLPRTQTFFEERSFTIDILERCQALLTRSEDGGDGYLLLAQGDECFYGLLRGGRITRAGQFTEGRAFDLTVSVFEHIVGRAEQGSFSLYGVEPMLFDALDLVLSRPPALQGTSRYVALTDLARSIRREGRDVVLTFAAAPDVNIAVFRRGTPFRLFLANHLAPSSQGTILDRIDGYLLKAESSRTPQSVTLALYDLEAESLPLLMAPAAEAELPRETMAAREAVIAVTFRGKTVERIPLTKPVTTVGRVKECDICIDNLGVSRVHCALVRTPEGLFLEDRGSLNGVVVNDELVRRTPLNDGDVILVGKHRLLVTMDALAPTTQMSDSRTIHSYEATMVLDSKVRPDLAQHLGRRRGSLPLSEAEPELGGLARVAAEEPSTADAALAFAMPKGAAIERRAAQVGGRKAGSRTPVLPAPAGRIRAPKDETPAAPAGSFPRLVFDQDTSFEMVAPVVTIGSGDDADLKIDGFLVGRSMARIVKEGTGRYRIESLSRLHRPRVNGATVRDDEMLFDGDEVRIGKSRFVFAAS